MPDEDRIRRRAHEIWEREGRPGPSRRALGAGVPGDRGGGRQRSVAGTYRARPFPHGHRPWMTKASLSQAAASHRSRARS
jgi:hypothetical protein